MPRTPPVLLLLLVLAGLTPARPTAATSVCGDLWVTNGRVYSVAVAGNTLYLGGDFSTIGGQPRDGLAALDAASGQATTWNPGALGTIFSLALGESAVYIGGDFSSVDGLPQASVAAIDTTRHLVYLSLLLRQ
jgi:hypothetical protein